MQLKSIAPGAISIALVCLRVLRASKPQGFGGDRLAGIIEIQKGSHHCKGKFTAKERF